VEALTMRARHSNGSPGRERGVVLFVALIVLVAMSLAGIAIFRSVDLANVISGNLAFKTSLTSAADLGIERARTWLVTAPGNLQTDNPGGGYFANWGSATGDFDPTGVTNTTAFDWNNNAVSSTDSAGNTIRYVIHRMCSVSNIPPNSSQCVMTTGGGSTVSSTFGSIDYSRTKFGEGTTVYYRITARVEGPRKTYSYVQALVY
jgi:type IV pilus assembly protein PilX